jgi:hypothetical protein
MLDCQGGRVEAGGVQAGARRRQPTTDGAEGRRLSAEVAAAGYCSGGGAGDMCGQEERIQTRKELDSGTQRK